MARWADMESCWGAPIARVMHPARAQIVESMRQTGRPLSAADLARSLGERGMAPRVEHHLHRLNRLGIVAPETRGRSSCSALAQPYCLTPEAEA